MTGWIILHGTTYDLTKYLISVCVCVCVSGNSRRCSGSNAVPPSFSVTTTCDGRRPEQRRTRTELAGGGLMRRQAGRGTIRSVCCREQED